MAAAAAAVVEPNDAINLLTSQLQSTNIKKIFKSNKDENVVIDILEESVNSQDGVKKYKTLWATGDITWEPKSVFSDYTLYIHSIKSKYNTTISQNDNLKSAYVYLRTSNPNDISIATQRDSIFSYCKNLGIKVSFLSEDSGISGRYNKKKNIMNNLDNELGYWIPYLEDGKHIMVVMSVDRLGRHTSSILTILDTLASRGVETHFIKENIIWNLNTPSHQKAIIQQSASQAEQHSDITSEKIKKTHARLRSEGHFIGKAPFGHRIYRDITGIRRLGKNKKELGIIRKVHSTYTKYKYIVIENNGIRRQLDKTEIYTNLQEEIKNDNCRNRNGKEFNITSLKYLINKYQNNPIPDDTEMYQEDTNYRPSSQPFNLNNFINSPPPISHPVAQLAVQQTIQPVIQAPIAQPNQIQSNQMSIFSRIFSWGK
jgi:DNA invertase Pin-like site-specific DNA recombinase